MTSKPYAASRKYIQQMSNYCETFRYSPDETTGDTACPFNGVMVRSEGLEPPTPWFEA